MQSLSASRPSLALLATHSKEQICRADGLIAWMNPTCFVIFRDWAALSYQQTQLKNVVAVSSCDGFSYRKLYHQRLVPPFSSLGFDLNARFERPIAHVANQTTCV